MKFGRLVLIVALALGCLAAPLAAEAQQAGKMYRIGCLSEGMPQATFTLGESLHDLGYVKGRSLVIERRFAAFKHE